jgi:hypothetical protein
MCASLRETLKLLDKIWVNEFLKRVNPVRQFRAIKELSDPGLFEKPTVRKQCEKTCKSALTVAGKPRAPPNNSYENATWIAGNRRTVYFSRQEGELPIVLDSGASYSVTPSLDNFLDPTRRPCATKERNGLNSLIKVVGVGMVKWKIQDLFGAVWAIKTEAYYVPDAGVRLFSPQVCFQKHKRGSYYLDHQKTLLELADGTKLHPPTKMGPIYPWCSPLSISSIDGASSVFPTKTPSSY